jgi:hypothetical protein
VRTSPQAALLGSSLTAVLGLSGCSGGADLGLGLGEERVAANEPAIEAELIELTEEISLKRREDEQQPLVYRFNQPKTVACLDAELVVGALPSELAVGLFATPARYPATLRFANATQFDDRAKDLRGLSIKVRGAPGARGVSGEDGVQDFTFNNYPALFAGTPDDFLSFVRATANGRAWAFFINPLDSHLRSLAIVLRARSRPDSPFAERYFSTTPYRFGAAGTAAKYSVQSCGVRERIEPTDGPDYLRDSIAKGLEAGPVCLAFMAQRQTDPVRMPLEDASVTWPEDLSPFTKVAELQIRPQPFREPAQMAACEALSFNPWSGAAAHQPLGGINRVRKRLYEELAAFRAEQNGFAR